jgi:acetolactate synthase-1/2/3 large subunit
MRDRPAATLLHLGAGLGNGIANLHNARRAGTPLINLVGDHALHHVAYDAPLTADIEGIARPVSAWVRTSRSASALAEDGIQAVAAALAANPNPTGGIATLIVPADCAWGPGAVAQELPGERHWLPVPDALVDDVAGRLDETTLLLLDGNALTEAGVQAAGGLAAKTGCGVLSSTFPARVESGTGLFPVPRLPYFPEQVQEALAGFRRIVLVGAEAPVSFFAYQGRPSSLVPDNCEVRRLAHRHQDGASALNRLAERLGAPEHPAVVGAGERPPLPEGPLTTASVSQILAAKVRDNCIVASDSGGGGAAAAGLQRAVRHTWLSLTGGAIGQGGPAALGAALACPDRTTYALLGDGGAMYTNQFLWTAAREKADLITVIYSNRAYNILDVEYRRLGVNEVGPRAASLFDLSGPAIDWVALAGAQGVPGVRADTAAAFADALDTAHATPGPFLIEADLTARQAK